MERIKIIGKGSPVVGIMSLVHGNEPCGLSAIDSLKDVKLKKGTLILIKANLEAGKENKRFLEKNLNRSFPGDENGLLEERIAFKLYPYIQKCDFLLDLHSTSGETDPFTIVKKGNPDLEKYALMLGIDKYVEMGDQLSGTSIDGEGIKFNIECGQHDNENSKKVAIKVVNNFLKSLGLIEGNVDEIKLSKFKVVETIKIDNKENFMPNSELEPFKMVKEGESLGSFPDRDVVSKADLYPLMIDKKIKEDYMYMMIPSPKIEDSNTERILGL